MRNSKGLVVLSFFFFTTFSLIAQDQSLSDSLKIVFRKNSYDRFNKLSILEKIAQSENSADEIIIYSKELIESAKEMDSSKYVYSGYLQMGNAYRLKGDLPHALENYFIASKIAIDNKLLQDEAKVKISIADAYSIMGDSRNAVKNYREGISIIYSEKKIDTIFLASAQLNLGDEYYNQKKLDSALYYFSESGRLFKEADYELGSAYNLGNLGLVYAEKNENKKAEENLNEAIKILETYEDFSPISEYLGIMSDIYFDKGNVKEGLKYLNRSVSIAESYGFKDQISKGYLKLSEFYEKNGDDKKSLKLFKDYITYRDSVNNIEKVQEIANAEKNYEVTLANEKAKFEIEKAENEKELLKQQKKTQTIIAVAIGIALLLICILAWILYKRNKFVVETSKVIKQEKERSDGLLKNILPEETAKELKESGSVASKRFDSVSVLFTDFKGFTKFSESLSPEELVKTIDFYFSKFDEIMEKHGIEKIKTVGDAYMCACGLPFPVENHAFKIVRAAFDIIDFVNEAMSLNSDSSFDIRVGINSGSVVAGVVGTKKFAYDIWGDTVNTASRMESSGAIGKINISESTYNLIKNNSAFEFEERGSIEAKGKGKIKMYFVRRRT